MIIVAHGLVIDPYGKVLLIRRDDTGEWALPGGAVEEGELPNEAAAREVEEETGLKVLAVRPVGLYFSSPRSVDHLNFTFRCLKRGGELTSSEDVMAAGYAQPESLTRAVIATQREMIEDGVSHQGGPPILRRQRLAPWISFVLDAKTAASNLWDRRRQARDSTISSPVAFEVGAFVVLRDQEGGVLWVQRRDYDVWNLPGGRREAGEAPWETAVRETQEETGLDVQLTDLSGVYLKPESSTLIFNFLGKIVGGQLNKGPESAAFANFKPGQEPENTLPKQAERVADATGPRETTLFRVQTGKPGLAQLGLIDQSPA